MKLVTIIFVILKYVSTTINGITAIIGAKKEPKDGVDDLSPATKPPSRWKRGVLILAILSFMVAIVSQVVEQIINARDKSGLTERLDSTSNQLDYVTGLLHESQKKADSYQKTNAIFLNHIDLTQEANSSLLNGIYYFLTQWRTQPNNCDAFIGAANRFFKQYAEGLTNSPKTEVNQKARQLIHLIDSNPEYWNGSQTNGQIPGFSASMPSTPPSPQNRKPGISDTPVMQVSSGSISYGTVPAGTSTAASFTVQNVGSGILSGTVTVEPPFSVLAGGTYRLGANQSQSVTVIFSPSVAGDYSQSLIFTGGAGASATVTGSATNIPTNLPTGTTTAPHPLPAPTGFKILKVGP